MSREKERGAPMSGAKRAALAGGSLSLALHLCAPQQVRGFETSEIDIRWPARLSPPTTMDDRQAKYLSSLPMTLCHCALLLEFLL